MVARKIVRFEPGEAADGTGSRWLGPAMLLALQQVVTFRGRQPDVSEVLPGCDQLPVVSHPREGERARSRDLGPEESTRRGAVPVDTEILGVLCVRESLLRHGIDEFDALIDAVDAIRSPMDRSPGR